MFLKLVEILTMKFFLIYLQITSVDLKSGADLLRVYSGGRSLGSSKLLHEITSFSENVINVAGINNFFIVLLISDRSLSSGSIQVSWDKGKIIKTLLLNISSPLNKTFLIKNVHLIIM